MKKALKVTLGAMLAVSMAAPIAAVAHDVYYNHIAVWGDLTYMQPTNNGLSTGDYALFPFDTALDGARNTFFLDPDSEFDYALGISYRLPHTHTRVFMSYDHFQTDNDRQGDSNVRNLGISINAGGAFAPTQGVTEFDLNAHEFRVGAIHDLHFGDHFCLDLKAFFEYDRVRQNYLESISRTAGSFFRTRESENLIKGFGPGVGFMTRWYSHSPHFHVFAGGNTALLKTDNEYHQTFAVVTDGGGGDAGHGYDYQPFESRSIVGKLDIEFGLNYHCAFRREMHGAIWDLALGVRYVNMINVFKNGNTMYQPNGDADNTLAPNFPAYLGAAQDWGKWGPFLRFKIGGAHS